MLPKNTHKDKITREVFLIPITQGETGFQHMTNMTFRQGKELYKYMGNMGL